MSDNFDNKLKEALIKGTDKSVSQKEEIWKNIQRRLELNEGEDRVMNRSKKTGTQKIAGIAVAVAVIASTIFTFTQPGQAAVGKIREFFAPQKTITEHIEGMPEQKDVNLQESEMGYVIYIDEALYTMEKGKGVDRITPINKVESLPEVYMEISQIADKDSKSVAAEIENQLVGNFKSTRNMGEVNEPVKGTLLIGLTGNKWNDTVVHYYVVDNTKGGTFVIKQQYFFEASEGHGARFYNMLKEFKIVESEIE